MMGISVSVVIPVFNRENSIGDAVRSVLGQSIESFEVLVVDDGSSDASAEVVERLGDPRVRCVRQANGGAGSARNHALDVASGDWIAFLDSDDTWLPERLASAARLVEAHPELDFLQCNRLHRYPDGRVDAGLRAGAAIVTDPVQLLSGFTMKTSAVMIRRALIERLALRFPTDQKTCEDYSLFWKAVMFARRIGYDAAPLVTINTVPESLSRSSPSIHLQRDNVKTLVEVRDWGMAQGAPPRYIDALREHLHWQLRDYFAMLIRERRFGSLQRSWRFAIRAEGWQGATRGMLSALVDRSAVR